MLTTQNAKNATGPIQAKNINKIVQYFGDHYEIDGRKIPIDKPGISREKTLDELKHSLIQNRKQLNKKEGEIELIAEQVGAIEFNNILYTAILNILMYALNIKELVEAITYEGGEEELRPNEAFPEEELNTRIEKGFLKYQERKEQEREQWERREQERKEKERREQEQKEFEQREWERNQRVREQIAYYNRKRKNVGTVIGLIFTIMTVCYFILWLHFKWFYGIFFGTIIGIIPGITCYFVYGSLLNKIIFGISCFLIYWINTKIDLGNIILTFYTWIKKISV